jgi:hypothetical protein
MLYEFWWYGCFEGAWIVKVRTAVQRQLLQRSGRCCTNCELQDLCGVCSGVQGVIERVVTSGGEV